MSPNYLYKSALVVVFLISMIVSCKKESAPTENSNIVEDTIQTNRIYNSMAPIYVRDSEFAIVQKLFQKNNLSLFDFQIWLYQSDTIGNHYVFCNQFYHGIQIMAYRVIFWFNNQDIYDNLVGELVGNITIDTIPSVTTNNAGILFRQAIASDSFNKNNLSSFRSYGFNAELELYDLNYGKEFVPKKFILVWIITVANGAKYPVGCIRADSLHLIYYDNGREYNR